MEKKGSREGRPRKRRTKVVVSGFANSPLQKDVGVANEDRVIEDSGTRQNMGPADAVRKIRAKL